LNKFTIINTLTAKFHKAFISCIPICLYFGFLIRDLFCQIHRFFKRIASREAKLIHLDTFEKREGFRIISACPLYQVSSKTGWWWNLKCGQTIRNKTLPNELFALCTRACLSIHSSCKSVIYIDEPELSIHTEQNRNWRLCLSDLWSIDHGYNSHIDLTVILFAGVTELSKLQTSKAHNDEITLCKEWSYDYLRPFGKSRLVFFTNPFKRMWSQCNNNLRL